MQRATVDRSSASAPNTAVRGWQRGVWLACLLGALVILARRQLTDFDLPWNLATGRIVLQTRQIPVVDDLAFTARPLRYVEVLGDTALYAIYAATGAGGLQLLCACVGLGTIGLLESRARHMGLLRWPWAALGLYALSDWFVMRPVLFSWLGLIVTLNLLQRHRLARDLRQARWALAALVPLFFAWANVHGFVALGVALALGYALYRSGARLLGRRSTRLWPEADGNDTWATLGLVSLAIGAACVNTMGPRLLLGPIRLNEHFGDITEWARPTFRYFVRQQPFLSLWYLASFGVWLAGRDRVTGSRVPSAFSIGEALFAALVTAGAVRMFPVGAILMAHAATSRADLHFSLRSPFAWACAACPLLALSGLALTSTLTLPAGFARGYLPVDAAEFVADVHPRGRMYNFMPFGGYLALRLWPEQRVLTDGRDVLAREQTLIDAITRATRDARGFAALDREFHFDWAVVSAREGERNTPALASSPDWVMLYIDDVAAVYARRGGASDALIRDGYRRLRHLLDPAALLASLDGDDAAARRDLAHDGALALAQAPDSPRAAFLGACGALAVRDAEAFEGAFVRLAWLTPGILPCSCSLSVDARACRTAAPRQRRESRRARGSSRRATPDGPSRADEAQIVDEQLGGVRRHVGCAGAGGRRESPADGGELGGIDGRGGAATGEVCPANLDDRLGGRHGHREGGRGAGAVVRIQGGDAAPRVRFSERIRGRGLRVEPQIRRIVARRGDREREATAQRHIAADREGDAQIVRSVDAVATLEVEPETRIGADVAAQMPLTRADVGVDAVGVAGAARIGERPARERDGEVAERGTRHHRARVGAGIRCSSGRGEVRDCGLRGWRTGPRLAECWVASDVVGAARARGVCHAGARACLRAGCAASGHRSSPRRGGGARCARAAAASRGNTTFVIAVAAQRAQAHDERCSEACARCRGLTIRSHHGLEAPAQLADALRTAASKPMLRAPRQRARSASH